MKVLNVVAFKKRDFFLIAIIVFIIALGYFSSPKDEEKREAPSTKESP
ncbi:hypothetical protein OAQ84_01185 [Bdellovibrionales bacterium]|nr:hypothetical protein [Bdellovibrionales bacterium]